MNRIGLALAVMLALSVLVDARSGPTSRPADGPKDPRAEKKRLAVEAYQALTADYMAGRWGPLADKFKTIGRQTSYLDREQRLNVMYVRKTASVCRPNWWKATKSPSNASFRATIWGRPFMANYVPASGIGAQQAFYDREKNQIIVVVTWRPEMVDHPKAAEGELAKRYGMLKGDLGEAAVWHELGHNYITKFLPVGHVLQLYSQHEMLFYHLQEFYADLTAVYHCSPRGRLVSLMIRLDDMRENAESEEHNRAAQAIGSLLLSHVLAEPEKWPSIHLPPAVPEEDPERKTIIYVYENIDPKWTLAEDKQFRQFIEQFVRRQGELTLRRRGQFTLANKLPYYLITAQDREAQVKRDAWVTERLTAAIKSGRADKPKAKGEEGSRFTRLRIIVPR